MKFLNLRIQLLIYFLISLSSISYANQKQQVEPIKFDINLNDHSNDSFKVSVETGKLDRDNEIFQFASTAPGTYQIMDIGRYVKNFKAFNKNGKELKTEKVSVNQFHLLHPKQVNKITYEIFDTWDFEVEEHQVYMMCGTSLEKDHAYINGQAVFGYIKGMQSRKMSIRIEYPSAWKIGTALELDAYGNYIANSFDHIVDSPFLLGRLSHSTIVIDNTLIDVYAYSKTDEITSDQILTTLEDMLKASSRFLEELPVKRYTFLYHFEDMAQGAWEHSYSSSYVMHEDDWASIEDIMKSTSSHEFFHIVTPLNIHSEIIGNFNFISPRSSDHLWLYEGVTEWAANNILFRDGQLSMEEYLRILHSKAENSDLYFDNDVSLVELARTSFTEEGQKNYSNIYNKGALVAELLNIKLLELSHGDKGLREVIIDLTQKYGPDIPFSEKDFFDSFTSDTYPEIGEFLDNYVKNTVELPFKEYFNKIGIDYIKSEASRSDSSFPYDLEVIKDELVVKSVSDEGIIDGIQVGDKLVSINNQETDLSSLYKIYQYSIKQEAGTKLELVLNRNSKEFVVNTKMIVKEDIHVFVVNPKPSAEQLRLRKKWMSKLN